jgi:hypothetical protein
MPNPKYTAKAITGTTYRYRQSGNCRDLTPNYFINTIKQTTVYAFPNTHFPCTHIEMEIRRQIVSIMPTWIRIPVPKIIWILAMCLLIYYMQINMRIRIRIKIFI